jgi:hypothetical protein
MIGDNKENLIFPHLKYKKEKQRIYSIYKKKKKLSKNKQN